MELDEHGYLEVGHLSQRREASEAYFPSGIGDFLSHENGSCFDYCCFDEGGGGMGEYCSLLPNPDLDALALPADVGFGCPHPTTYCGPLGAIPQLAAIPPAVQSPSPTAITTTTMGPTTFGRSSEYSSSREEHISALDGKYPGLVYHQGRHLLGPVQVVPKLEELNQLPTGSGGLNKASAPALPLAAFDVGSSSSSSAPERKARAKKIEGQPSKNLLAERRRRKRLNDRLSILRSVVPKISKMDRTSILGDAVEYMKELLDRIKRLQEEMESSDGGSTSASEEAPPPVGLLSMLRDLLDPSEVLARNIAPKFDVERREVDTRVEICCARNPGLLLSILSTLEMLGLEIQQCVISCFNDFGMQASCFEHVEQRALVSSEEMKQALFRNAGYGGKCV